ncbi:MAG: bifunctional acetate--CoA ligase family protein/GNAT family N-acetyltransferase [Gammaproteobacteria bacterium]|nr:bifunctional acetate--CoA ligase family protein/GNAT family N-acetyltransferase [Gammaproteobacteria bacterium]
MSVLNLDSLLKPKSVALIGASENPESLGCLVYKNLLGGHFDGPIRAVNPKYDRVLDRPCYKDIDSLPEGPDLAVIATPAATVPAIISQLGERGTRAAIVLSAGFREDHNGGTLEQDLLDAAQPHGLRILGPNCVGLLLPNLGLNASFAHTDSLPGKLALISQSGALCTTIIDWAKSRGIGFSHFISLGNGSDVDFGDLLDYLGNEAATTGILLYIESINEARKFMSAARATARNKPVIVIKSGRVVEGARAATSHTGALAGSDDVFATAIHRAGMLRVYTIEDLFGAVETLARARRVHGNRLAILTNGGGPGVLATDALISGSGQLAELGEQTINELDELLPANWSHGNPVDIIGDSGAERYVNALRILLGDKNHDAILIMLVPVAVIDNTEVARAITREIKQSKKPVFTCWMGADAVEEARRHFKDEGIPGYETPDAAIQAFLQMVEYDHNQKALMQTPKSVPEDFTPDRDAAHSALMHALDDNRDVLTEPEAKNILKAYGIPVVETRTARDIDEAIEVADDIGYPVALKILSPDITHKSDVGGVLLNIESDKLLQYAAEGMLSRMKRLQPDARIEGFSVQQMSDRPHAHELIIGATTDNIFGPVVLFGKGGTAVEVVNDKAVALPPLNMMLAEDLMSRTRIYRELRGYRDTEAADLDAIRLTLLKISQLIIDHPEIQELDINPLFADSKGVLALDARIKVARTDKPGTERLAIRPYPQELEEWTTAANGRKVLLRPIKPEDEAAHHELFRRLSPQDVYFRFFRAIGDIQHDQLARFTQIDYDREMAFIATAVGEDGQAETLGVARAVSDADNNEAEFAIVIASDSQGSGLGYKLLDKLIRYCRKRGMKRIVGVTLADNNNMRRLAKRFGFQEHFCTDNTVQLRLDLEDAVEPVSAAQS